MAEIKIIVSGPVGCGKSAILGEIEILMKALGVPVRYEDAAAAQSEKNMTHADWTEVLEMYKPSVVLVEDMPWLRDAASAQQDEREALIRALEAAIREAESYEHRAVSVANIRAAISLISTELPAMASDEMIDAACAAVTPPLYRVDAMRAVEAALRAAQQVQADAGAVAYIPDDALARLTPPLLVLDGVRLYRYNAVGTTALYTRPAAESVKRDDAALLDWLMHNIGGNALRAIGVITSAGCDRSAIRAAMSREQSGGSE